ncbi:hypothetical protein PIROE2DRAFT_69522 [Piromyces sp. E2]|nr:hypothetical protein PIROE2DRAFT_69522 [Piromyces sp. E2]|eukprot:OUM62243.1 hypothetical protein PIROE2DRAFT_69522 [Piromyces sp. E2]
MNSTTIAKRPLRFESGTCDSKAYDTFLDGLFTKIQDAFFYVNVLQFAIVTLMYLNIGKGRYWKLLFYAATAGFVGCLIENGTVAYICRKEDEYNFDKYKTVIPFFITEFCWVVEEYTIPFLNLTKMKVFSKGKLAKLIDYVILGLFPVFVACRFYIGYNRMTHGVLATKETKYGHNYKNPEVSTYQTKSIVKNYTNVKSPSSQSTYYDSSSPSQNFGFLYQSKEYSDMVTPKY